jgi:bacteriorhodopsin
MRSITKTILGLIILLFINNSELYPDRIAIEFIIIDTIATIIFTFAFVFKVSRVNILPNLSIKKYILDTNKKMFAKTIPRKDTF